MDLTFAIDVPVTDRTRSGGSFNVVTHRVIILAPDVDTATLAAAQMVAGRAAPDHMVIATTTTGVTA